jgi:hypothetical protein
MDEVYLKKFSREIMILLLAGMAYYIFYTITGIGVPCIFRTITGYKCPGCGVTHMVVHMSHMEFVKAYNDNQLLFTTWPLLIGELIYMFYLRLKQKKMSDFNKLLLVIYILILMVFGALRNILMF